MQITTILVFIVVPGILTPEIQAQNKWALANTKIIRLAPDKFKQLPKPIVSYLNSRKCRIPQLWGEAKLHNVIKGVFLQKGITDWAILQGAD